MSHRTEDSATDSFSTWGLHDERREPTPGHGFLTSTHIRWWCMCAHAYIHTYIQIHVWVYNKLKYSAKFQINKNKDKCLRMVTTEPCDWPGGNGSLSISNPF